MSNTLQQYPSRIEHNPGKMHSKEKNLELPLDIQDTLRNTNLKIQEQIMPHDEQSEVHNVDEEILSHEGIKKLEGKFDQDVYTFSSSSDLRNFPIKNEYFQAHDPIQVIQVGNEQRVFVEESYKESRPEFTVAVRNVQYLLKNNIALSEYKEGDFRRWNEALAYLDKDVISPEKATNEKKILYVGALDDPSVLKHFPNTDHLDIRDMSALDRYHKKQVYCDLRDMSIHPRMKDKKYDAIVVKNFGSHLGNIEYSQQEFMHMLSPEGKLIVDHGEEYSKPIGTSARLKAIHELVRNDELSAPFEEQKYFKKREDERLPTNIVTFDKSDEVHDENNDQERKEMPDFLEEEMESHAHDFLEKHHLTFDQFVKIFSDRISSTRTHVYDVTEKGEYALLQKVFQIYLKDQHTIQFFPARKGESSLGRMAFDKVGGK